MSMELPEQPVRPVSDDAERIASLRSRARRIARSAWRVLCRAASILSGCAAVLLLAAFIAGVAVYEGWYDVAATSRNGTLFGVVGDFALHQSVARRAASLEAPPPASGLDLQRAAMNYRTSCEACHRGPGVTRAAIADALNPEPIDLSLNASRWTRPQLFWIIRNGIRMSGMPTWRDNYSDREIWQLATLVSALPGMSPADYLALQSACVEKCEGAGAHPLVPQAGADADRP